MPKLTKLALLLLIFIAVILLLGKLLGIGKLEVNTKISTEQIKQEAEEESLKQSASKLFEARKPRPVPIASPKPAVQIAPASALEPKLEILNRQRDQGEQTKSRFTKIAFNGDVLNEEAAHWSCARDMETGLLWETKLFNAGVSDAEHTYSWYAPDHENPGRENSGHCFGIPCDTHAYTLEMNRLALCGSEAWRLPSFSELESLIDRRFYNPTINQHIFQYGQGSAYWTGTELENNPEMVMQINFFNGISNAVPKNLTYSVRLLSQ